MSAAKKRKKQAASKVTQFQQRVYDILSTVPRGKVTTYRDIAHALGTGAYRSVGQALKRNPYAPKVPCHRVVASDGSIGGFFGETEGEPVARKIAMLKKEGIHVVNNKVVGFEQKRHEY